MQARVKDRAPVTPGVGAQRDPARAVTLSQQLPSLRWAEGREAGLQLAQCSSQKAGDACCRCWATSPSVPPYTPPSHQLPRTSARSLCRVPPSLPPPRADTRGASLCDIRRSARAAQPCTRCLCQQPRCRTCCQEGRRAMWVSVCYCRPSPFSSVGAGKPPRHTTRRAEGLVPVADPHDLTVNSKTKSLCTARQPLLHPPG